MEKFMLYVNGERKFMLCSAFFVTERTGMVFRHLSTDFQSFNPMSDENWTKLWDLQ
jgi:hypothetical protein